MSAAQRVALVHDWLTGMRGGERVLERIARFYPGATIHTLVWDRGRVSREIEAHPIRTSFLQRLPAATTRYRWFLPLFPRAIESFDLSRYDAVVSTSHAVAKGARQGPGAPHLAYVFTPMRYIWELEAEYFPPERYPGPIGAYVRHACTQLRAWDRATAGRPTALYADSAHVADRIRRHWGREAGVLYPGVDLASFTPAGGDRDYYLLAGAFAPYKRGDLAIAACSRLGRPLVVVGGGPDAARLQAQAGPQVTFRSGVSDAELGALYQGARALLFPGEEDFGIVPLEAMASGCPVIAYGRGGAVETVGRGAAPAALARVVAGQCARVPGGMLFGTQSVDGLCAAIEAFEREAFAPRDLAAHVAPFSVERFDREMHEALVAAGIPPQNAGETADHPPPAPGRGFAVTVAGNSLWNLLQSVVTAVSGISISILAARYLGSDDFGVLTYVVWLATMIATVADLGLDQLLRKYVPAWFHRTDTRSWALRIAWRAIAIQLAMAGLLVAALLTSFPWWSRSLTIAHPRLETVMVLGLITVVPTVVARCAGTFLRSIQATRGLALVSMASQAANLALVAAAVAFRLPLIALLAAGLIAQAVLAGGLVVALRRRGGPAPPPMAEWPARELTRYAGIAYANVLIQQVVWSRSETLFLGLYSPAREVGFYGLAYGIAGMIGGLIGVSQQALFAAQFQLLAGAEEARSDRLASLSIKYLGLAFLPLCLVIWLFLDSAVLLLYGPAYQTVARVFPYVLFATVVANILNPVWTKVHLSNRKFVGTLGIGVAGAALNITLDLLLIPAHHAWGAAVANCVSQVCVVAMGMSFVALVAPVQLERRALGAVALVNLLLGGVFWLVLAFANLLALKLLVTAIAAAVYLRWLASWGAFGAADHALLAALEAGAPRWLQPLVRLARGGMRGVAAT